MAKRTGSAVWQGDLKGGKGTFKVGSGAFEGVYSFSTRFENEPGTNPEELIAAAHAACFSMAFANGLAKAGFAPDSVSTTANATFEKLEEGWRITNIHLVCEAKVPGIDAAGFAEQAQAAKTGCPVSNALKAVDITLDAKLVN
jgi:osmotically inducible protein OsmC